MFIRDARDVSADAAEIFSAFSWFFGTSLNSPVAMFQSMFVVFFLMFAAAGVIGLVAWMRLLRDRITQS
jgi:hypothetical protein